MATLFDEYVAEEKAVEGIKGIVKMCHKFGQSYEIAKDSVLEEYPDISESLIDEIIDEVYELVK